MLELFNLSRLFNNISYWPKNKAGNLAKKMHPHLLGDFEEDGIFFEERFFHHYFIFRRFPYPNLAKNIAYLSGLSQKSLKRVLGVHANVLKKVLYMRAADKILILKENECADILGHIAAHYPQATFIVITRDSKTLLASYETLSVNSTKSKTGINPQNIPGWAEENLKKRFVDMECMVDFFKKEDGCIKIAFDVFVDHIYETVQYIYSELGLRISDEYAVYLKDLQSKQELRSKGYLVNYHYPISIAYYDDFARMVTDSHLQKIGARYKDVGGGVL